MRQNARERLLYSFVLLAAAIWFFGLDPESRVSLSPRIYPTGVTIYDPAQAYNSFMCFSAPDGHTHLVDMDGNEVHGQPGLSPRRSRMTGCPTTHPIRKSR